MEKLRAKASGSSAHCDVGDSAALVSARGRRKSEVFFDPNPDHHASKKRINRIRGQLEAVDRMIDSRRYCPDILQQIRATTNALRSLESEVLRGHLRGCVKKAFDSKNAYERNDKIEEILLLWNK